MIKIPLKTVPIQVKSSVNKRGHIVYSVFDSRKNFNINNHVGDVTLIDTKNGVIISDIHKIKENYSDFIPIAFQIAVEHCKELFKNLQNVEIKLFSTPKSQVLLVKNGAEFYSKDLTQLFLKLIAKYTNKNKNLNLKTNEYLMKISKPNIGYYNRLSRENRLLNRTNYYGHKNIYL